jgi:hypothetical protein
MRRRSRWFGIAAATVVLSGFLPGVAFGDLGPDPEFNPEIYALVMAGYQQNAVHSTTNLAEEYNEDQISLLPFMLPEGAFLMNVGTGRSRMMDTNALPAAFLTGLSPVQRTVEATNYTA